MAEVAFAPVVGASCRCAGQSRAARRQLGAYETPIDKMLSLPPQRAILERVPDQGAEPRPDGP